jgi:hypothetical protein
MRTEERVYGLFLGSTTISSMFEKGEPGSMFNIDGPPPARKGKKSFIKPIWISVAFGLFAIGSTFAGSITINSGQGFEFGQGVLRTTACDTSITANIKGGYDTSTAKFNVTQVILDQIDSSAQHCKGVDFHIKFYSKSAEPLTIYTDSSNNPVKELIVFDDGTNFIKYVNAFSISPIGSTGFTLDISKVGFAATGIEHFTIETSEHTYLVGETGPADGVVFLYMPEGFPCGPTLNKTCFNLEIAPNGWFGQADDPILPWSTNAFKGTLVPLFNGFAPTNTGSHLNDVGYGLAFNLAIIAQNGPYNSVTNSYAAGAAASYEGGGYKDWYLPNFGEAVAFSTVYGKLIGQLGYDAGKEYWTSVECGPGAAYKIARDGSNTFYVGGCNSKEANVHPIRPIHAF